MRTHPIQQVIAAPWREPWTWTLPCILMSCSPSRDLNSEKWVEVSVRLPSWLWGAFSTTVLLGGTTVNICNEWNKSKDFPKPIVLRHFLCRHFGQLTPKLELSWKRKA